MRGLVVTAAVDCALQTTTAVCGPFLKAGLKLPSLRLLPPPTYTGTPQAKGEHQPLGIAVTVHLNELRELIPRLFSAHHVQSLYPGGLQSFLGRRGTPVSRAILFTEKTRVPVVWRAVSSYTKFD
jgi:hypothetical protein